MNVASAPPLTPDLERLVIVCPNWIGDTVMATPLLRALRKRLPRTRIVLALRGGLAELLRGCPWVDQLQPVTATGPLGPARLARVLRRLSPQAVLLLPNGFRTALAAWLARVPTRVGYDRDTRGALLTHRLKAEDAGPIPMVHYFNRLAQFAAAAEDEHRLELFVSEEEESAAARLLDGVDAPFVVINPGANRPDKRWPPERFAALADALHESHGLAAVVTGAPGEASILAGVTDAAKAPIVNLQKRGLGLGPLKAIVRRAALMVTNDTGPRHIAAALGTPLVSLFGPTDHRWTTLTGVREWPLLAEPFLPEELIADRHPRMCVIDRIPVSDAIAAARAVLGDDDRGRSS